MNIFGYYLEYYKNNKYIGKLRTDIKDRENIGYRGKMTHKATDDIRIGKKKIKKGEEYMTILYPLNGR